jgi:hypothetical protein
MLRLPEAVPSLVFRQTAREYGLNPVWLRQSVWGQRDKWKSWVAQHQPGQTGLRKKGSKEAGWRRGSTSQGKRLPGARGYLGKTDHLRPLWLQTVQWCHRELEQGFSLARSDLVRDFERRLDVALEAAERQAERRPLSKAESARLQAWRQKTQSLQNQKGREKYSQNLANKAELAERKTQRITGLSTTQESARMKAGWLAFDRALWLAAAGSLEDLQGLVALPDLWVRDRARLVLLFSDQVPVWLQVGAGRLLVDKRTLRIAKVQSQLKRDRRRKLLLTATGSSNAAATALQELLNREAAEEASALAQAEAALELQAAAPVRTQTRGPGGNDRWRVSLVCRQAIFNYGQSETDPRGPHF